ncbi:hypothetical protein GQ53DRAFT_653374, partial [Thozetella sp. PMI_491]
IKCDQSQPRCRACVRLGVHCPGYGSGAISDSAGGSESAIDDIFKASGVEKRKIGSCEACRRSKIACSKHRPTCRRCSKRHIDCIYPGRRKAAGGEGQSEPQPSRLESSVEATSDVGRGLSTPAANSNLDMSVQWSVVMRRLYCETLPEDPSMTRKLIEAYFTHIHPLRCLGFIHKPAFMQSLDRGNVVKEYGEALVYIMCAFGARYVTDGQLPSGRSGPDTPGQKWAEKAAELVLQGMWTPSALNLMAMLLFCEYGVGTDHLHAMVFQLLGCCHRLTRLLMLEQRTTRPGHSSPEETSQMESLRRLFWSCYILDTIVGAGVEGNASWREWPQVPLPASESDFISQISPSALFLPSNERFSDPKTLEEMSIQAHAVYIVTLRSRVLRLIRQSSLEGSINDPDSLFLQLVRTLDLWYEQLPERFSLSPLKIYIHKDQNTLGAIFYLHLAYHGAIADLTRVSLPGFSFPMASAFRDAPQDFQSWCQQRCRYHSDKVSECIQMGLPHGAQPFHDPFCHIAAFEASKVQIIHTVIATSNSLDERRKAGSSIRANIKLMEMRSSDVSGIHRRTILPLLRRFGFHDIVDEWKEHTTDGSLGEEDDAADITGPADAAYLTSLSTFRRAQAKILPSNIATSPYSWSAAGESSPRETVRRGEQRGLFNSFNPAEEHHPGEGSMQLSQPVEGSSTETTEMLFPTVESMEPGLSSEEFGRLAHEWSDYLTWDFNWWQDFNGDGF